jgi:hypothetical protein
MLVHRVWKAQLSYPYRAGRLLGTPSEGHGEPSIVHGERAGASENEKSTTESAIGPTSLMLT